MDEPLSPPQPASHLWQRFNVLIYLPHASRDVYVCWGRGSDEGSGTRVVCCCSPQQMESVNTFTRPPWQTLFEEVVGATEV